MAEKMTDIARREGESIAPRQQLRRDSPFTMLERFANEMDTLFDDFGIGRNALFPRWSGSSQRGLSGAATSVWAPTLDVYQQNNELVVRADLPGMKKEDVCIDVTDSDLTISGERRQ